ncbi:MAG: hypothetical protein CL674_14550 [Bdellovibrionaceae bacterium]|jgi:transcriptional regulator with XRE-family HTH domain|nr:hypothetical protein [Pseudobdellovibrionaceae bacterium]MAF92487.1 hypothetical protein [Pseudobdellovibrionaceae bacterium]QDP47579.1 MAG: hypothetical protein GOVbin1174_27 [Prokaryotic dsDNA virus sp.]|tara:strand:- start:28118 stop:28591 length:474 start_codon:yes stop_codon:yes gene_type:complete
MKARDILANNLSILREQMKISQTAMANLLGVNYTTYGRWERNEFSPTLENIDTISKTFDIELPRLFIENLGDYKPKADPNPTLEALSELVVEQKQKLKALELSDNEKRIIEEYRRCQPLQRMAIETMAGFGLDKNPDAEILDLMKQVNSKAGSKKTS